MLVWPSQISNYWEMHQSTLPAAILSISVDRESKETLRSQLTQSLRRLVHERRLQPGDRLPSTRMLARELSVSRVTATAAYDQLVAEGYLEARWGSGVYVASDLPEPTVVAPRDALSTPIGPLPQPDRVTPFDTGFPDLREFPYREWARLFDKVWRDPDATLLARPDHFGWGPLREAVARHLRAWRGITCDPGQVVITSGLLEAVELISTVLPQGKQVLMEEPGHRVLRRALVAGGFSCVPFSVDDHGLDITHASSYPLAVAAAVTPSRQFPLGMTLPLARRLQLLNWSSRTGSYVLEDDYDGEYRYRGQPLPAMMSLDDGHRVIYIGSFSKVLFPALRLGFIVLPKPLLAPVARRLRWTGARAALPAQPVLAQFIDSGAFATHVRRMRRLYALRQEVLIASIRQSAPTLLEIEGATGGMHLVAGLAPELGPRIKDTDIVAAAATMGLRARALSSFYAGAPARQGLVLGYAAFNAAEIHEGAAGLAKAIAVCQQAAA